MPDCYPTAIDGFNVMPVGQGEGDIADTVVSCSCESYLKNRRGPGPFLLVASLHQPHGICHWGIKGKTLVPEELPFPELADHLPELPPNNKDLPEAPEMVNLVRYGGFSEEQWRYYLYSYYRQVEMFDADLGRILDALEASGHGDNTIVILTSDHGDGRGRHQNVQKWHPYDESMKVPLIVSCPGRIPENHPDTVHLVSGLDIMNTVCDYAGVAPPPHTLSRSLRPLLEVRPTQWRGCLSAECHHDGRILRTADFKYVMWPGDPVEQLFDMKNDPWEMRNLYRDAQYADVLADHRELLARWTARLDPVEPTPVIM